MKVLITIDDSKFSEAVINEAANRSWGPKTEIMVLSVVAIPTSEHWQDWGLSVAPKIKERLLSDAKMLVGKNVALLKEHLEVQKNKEGIKIEGKIVEGHTCDSIARVASHWQADMIMMGSHGRTGIGRFLLGSIAEGVLLRAPCSVEIIKRKKKTSRKRKVTVLY